MTSHARPKTNQDEGHPRSFVFDRKVLVLILLSAAALLLAGNVGSHALKTTDDDPDSSVLVCTYTPIGDVSSCTTRPQ